MSGKLLKEVHKLYQEANPLECNSAHYDKILKILEQLTQNEEYLETSLSLRWHIYYLRAKYDLALNDLNKLIELNPLNRSVFYNRGFLKQHCRDYATALLDFEEVIRLTLRWQDDDLIDAVEHHIIELKEKLRIK